jgi:hypothetical protein
MTGNNGGIVIQDRDRHLLRELPVMRVIDREQAKCVAKFGSTTRANTRLLAMKRAGLIRSFSIGTTVSGKKALYSLSKRGAALVDVPYRGLRRASDETIVADVFLTHQLRINEIYLTVKYRPIPVPDVRFLEWKSFHAPIHPNHSLIPDGYFALAVPGKTLAAYLEIDLGNESRSVWRKKAEAYISYAISGTFEQQFSLPQFRTLVVANSERRLASLRAATAELTEKIFWFTTFEAVTKNGFWSAIWQRPTDPRLQSLI